MKRKAYSGRTVKIVKTSITLPEVLVRFAESQMVDEGHPTLSSYLVYLLHRAREQEVARKQRVEKLPGPSYPARREEITTIEERGRAEQDVGTARVLSSGNMAGAAGSSGISGITSVPGPGSQASSPGSEPPGQTKPGRGAGRRAAGTRDTSFERKSQR